MMHARQCYEKLRSYREEFLDTAVECSRLTLPYLIRYDDRRHEIHKSLYQPWQSVGAKAVTTLAAKLMLALLPPQTTFFKMQVRDDKLGEEIPQEIRTELDLSFSKMERMVMDYINASSDRVMIHQAMKHLIVGGNALLYMGKEGIKHYPLNRYVVERDGNGNVIQIITKEVVSRHLLNLPPPKPNAPGDDGQKQGGVDDDVEVYTHVKLNEKKTQWIWHQEAMDKVIPGTNGSAPKKSSPWIVLRFNTVDGEDYGRSRVEEFIGDLRALDSLSQALVEGSSVAAKVVFLVSPSSTTKPQTLAQAGNGAIVQGRPEDVQVVQVGKNGDFATAAQMAQTLERRIGDGFLQLNVRQSERTTAEEVRLTQLELEQQLGGIFSLLTVEFLVPYLDRILMVLQRDKEIPKIPKDLVRPQIVAGVNALGRGSDRESLTAFVTTIAQTMGPEALVKYIDPSEYIKRLAAAQGIETLNLIKTEQAVQGEMQQQQAMAQQMELTKQAGQFANADARIESTGGGGGEGSPEAETEAQAQPFQA
ncbi:MAG: portal protein [Candidatus Poseidoniales archaeon]